MNTDFLKKLEKKLYKIRFFEETLDKLFEKQIIYGTFHRCIGQEATAIGICSNLNHNDFIVSNHRNHGHYLAFSDDYNGLLDELKGANTGVSGGRGGSQVIFGKNFISNGILGTTVAIATGIAHSYKLDKKNNCVVCFIGDGAMCEGIFYESINIASIWQLPILFVVEYNHIAQSTNTSTILAGELTDKFKAFNIDTHYIKSTDFVEILNVTNPIINSVKNKHIPKAIIVDANRLCAHSKGDDNRTNNELKEIKLFDPVNIISKYISNKEEIKREAQTEIEQLTGITIL